MSFSARCPFGHGIVWGPDRELWLGVLGSRQLVVDQRIVDFSQAAAEAFL